MKKLFVATLFISFALSFQSCLEDKCTTTSTYFRYTPVYITEADLQAEIKLEDARELKNPGKMYFYNNLIFINERFEGIHIYNNVDPSNPINLGFVAIPGNLDIAIKDEMMYADALVDLLTIDISDIQNPSLVDRMDDAFEVAQSGELGFIAYYTKSEITEEYDGCHYGNIFWQNEDVLIDTATPTSGSGGVTGAPTTAAGGTGTGGSTARITIVGEHLYLIDKSDLSALFIANASNPSLLSKQNVGWNIETIFPYQDKLFIGSESGMFIFDNSNPSNPEQLSVFEHARACDPVVVKDNTAYVTLRDGSICEGFINQLDVIDITDLLEPTLIKSYEMTNPHGLAIRDNNLYLCEGSDGLKIFDATDNEKIDENLIHHEDSFNAFDVISLTESHLLIIGSDGFYQYNVADKMAPVLLSHIPVVQ